MLCIPMMMIFAVTVVTVTLIDVREHQLICSAIYTNTKSFFHLGGTNNLGSNSIDQAN